MTASKGFTRSIRLIPDWMNVQALVARLTRVSGVNKNQLNPKFNALVNQELAQLVKTPTVASAAFGLASRQLVCAIINSTEVFKSNDTGFSFGFFNQLVADYVVLMRLKASLLT